MAVSITADIEWYLAREDLELDEEERECSYTYSYK